MTEIVLDYRKNPELFNDTAKKTAEEIGAGKEGVQNTQIRKFYDKVLELDDRARHESFDEILPFVKMLNSKVAYASQRKSGGKNIVNKAFGSMMATCIKQVQTKEDLHAFKLFFEAVIGFHKSLEGRR